MKELTKAEEQIMQIIWKTDGGFVKDIVAEFDDPKPAYNTVSTIIRILETKGFLDHKSFGKTYQYFPLVSKEEYQHGFFKKFINNYFDNSFRGLLSFFSKEGDLSIEEMEEIKKIMQTEIENKKAGR
ncbi:MAG: BlaI/MecI/CopY family transcriptional regulator [Salinivirgaceae bacterium]|nr:BlaI/MecI/CopY family transcriptional regulator [Salinivirgaceae bacterium]MDD4747251.1 BlaI/MecI/CopY family transcriptional regulator [Salinivirgaceae bacterium]MDY0280722.1 BlaI/MecI/CopY family transcriptional regulator [Salinivirgaceae bacterium]